MCPCMLLFFLWLDIHFVEYEMDEREREKKERLVFVDESRVLLQGGPTGRSLTLSRIANANTPVEQILLHSGVSVNQKYSCLDAVCELFCSVYFSFSSWEIGIHTKIYIKSIISSVIRETKVYNSRLRFFPRVHRCRSKPHLRGTFLFFQRAHFFNETFHFEFEIRACDSFIP